MRVDLTGRVALVTGGSRGIGRAIAVGLARAGATVCINYRAQHDRAKETLQTIEAAGGHHFLFPVHDGDRDHATPVVTPGVGRASHLPDLVDPTGIVAGGAVLPECPTAWAS